MISCEELPLGGVTAATDIQQLDLVQQCIWLEAPLCTSFTHQICQSLRSDASPLEAESPRDYMPWWKLNTILHLSCSPSSKRWELATNQRPWPYRNEASDSTSSLGWWHSPSLECIPMDVRVYWVSMSWDTICVTCPRVFRTCLLTFVIHCLWTAPIWLLCWNLVPVVISCFTPMLCRPWCKSNWV